MVKSYAKFEFSRSFGVVASATSNALWVEDASSSNSRHTGAGRAIVAANEEVLCWDVKKGELLSKWHDPACKAQATVIARSKTDLDVFAVGYSDGTIRLWDSKTATILLTFNGHHSAVTALTFDASGTRLASGSRDTHIIVWDLITETGLYRLRGHKDQITGLEFLAPPTPKAVSDTNDGDDDDEDIAMNNGSASGDGWLLSTGKDTYIKLWEITTQHCVETHVAHVGECWALGLSPDESGCITAGNDGEIKIWGIDKDTIATSAASDDVMRIIERGVMHRQSREKPLTVSFHPSQPFIAVHGNDKSVEVLRIRNEGEIQKAMARKRKRKRAKDRDGEDDENVEKEDIVKAEVSAVFVSHSIVRTQGKVRSLSWATVSGTKKSKSLQMLVTYTNNCIDLFSVTTTTEKERKKEAEAGKEVPEYDRLYTIELPGHRTDVRALALSSDNLMLASASNGSLKIWNVKTATCIRTFECGYALCCSFLPGDKIVVVGTKSGALELFDVASAVMIENVEAHEGAVWSVHIHPDGKGMVSGSADKSAKFWNFEIVQEEILGTKRTTPRLRLIHTRLLKLNDDILSIRFTPSGQFLAVALLDNTVKIFYNDSLKLFHNLYGHKLPVLSMDISSDSKLIATCSADKNVRLWGLDFGDCHKSFFAHQDSVMSVAFEKVGHNFFSAGKDRLLKYWDGDKFENIMKLDGHHGEIWAMCVSKSAGYNGGGDQFVVTASHDKSIRVWQEGDDQIFLEEEREKELEELYESTLTASLEKSNINGEAGGEGGEGEVGAAGKQTMETLKAGEKIVEALELGIEDLKIIEEWEIAKLQSPNLAPPNRNILYKALNNISSPDHILQTLSRIPASHLQDALLVLRFEHVLQLFTFIEILTSREKNIPLVCRVLFFLLKVHHNQIVASKSCKTLLDGIRGNLRKGLKRQKDEMGFNLAGVRYVAKGIEERGRKDYVDEEVWEDEEKGRKEGRRKRTFVNIA